MSHLQDVPSELALQIMARGHSITTAGMHKSVTASKRKELHRLRVANEAAFLALSPSDVSAARRVRRLAWCV